MTRTIVYGCALLAAAGATATTIASNLLPSWVTYTAPPPAGGGDPFWQALGLHQSCSSEARPTCRPFPHSDRDCAAALGPGQQYFCSVWRSVGFLMALALVAELATLVGFVVVLAGGRLKRETGWRVLGVLLATVAAVQTAALSIVAYLLDHDDRFLVPGWRLDTAWILCTVSAAVAVLCGVGLALSAVVLPPEDGYEFLDDWMSS